MTSLEDALMTSRLAQFLFNMDSDHSISSAVTILYEDPCIQNLTMNGPVASTSGKCIFFIKCYCIEMSTSGVGAVTFETWLDEIVSCPSIPENDISSVIRELTNDGSGGVAEEFSVNDFDLSLLGPTTENSLITANLVYDSLKLRISDIENNLGIFQFSFWKVLPNNAPRVLSSLCCELLSLQVSENDFTVVRKLDHRRSGVLVRVSSFFIKNNVLRNAVMFRARGFNVDVA